MLDLKEIIFFAKFKVIKLILKDKVKLLVVDQVL